MPILRNNFEKSGYSFLKKKKVKFEYEGIKLPYILKGTYNPDFFLKDLNRIIEFKGQFRPEDKRKMVAVKQQYPDLDIRIVFYSFNKKYIKWCEKYGFPYAIKDIPEEWLHGLPTSV